MRRGSTQKADLKTKVKKETTLIWVDANSKQTDQDTKNTISYLERVTENLKLFQNVEDCAEFIEKNGKLKFMIVVSGSLGKSLMTKIHSMKNVLSIFVFCGNKNYHESWAKNWSKIRSVETKIESICSEVSSSNDRVQSKKNVFSLIRTKNFDSAKDLLNVDPGFIFTRILTKDLENFQEESDDHMKLIRSAWEIFPNEIETMKKINEFRFEYQPSQSLLWYRENSFMTTLVDDALNNLDINLVSLTKYFIRDLKNEIENRRKTSNSRSNKNKGKFWFGESFSEEKIVELQQNEKNFITSNNFLWMNFSRSNCLKSAWRKSETFEELPVLFEIEIDPSKCEFFCAMDDENLIFRFGAVFQLEKIFWRNDEKFLEIHLNFVPPEKIGIEKFFRFDDELRWSNFGDFLRRRGDLSDAEKFFENFLATKIENSNRKKILIELGRIKIFLGKNSEAEKILFEAVEICKLEKNEIENGEIHEILAEIFSENHRHDEALKQFLIFVDAQRKILPDNHLKLGEIYRKLASFYEANKDFDAAIRNREISLKIFEKNSMENEASFVANLEDLAKIYRKKGKFSRSLELFQQVLEIKQRTLPIDHPMLIDNFDQIGQLLVELRHFDKALEVYERTLMICKNVLPRDHPQTGEIFLRIGMIYYEMKLLQKALLNFEMASEILRKSYTGENSKVRLSREFIEKILKNET